MFYSLPQAARTLGVTYQRLYWAILIGKIKPHRAGHSRILTDADVAALRVHFAERDARKAVTC